MGPGGQMVFAPQQASSPCAAASPRSPVATPRQALLLAAAQAAAGLGDALVKALVPDRLRQATPCWERAITRH